MGHPSRCPPGEMARTLVCARGKGMRTVNRAWAGGHTARWMPSCHWTVACIVAVGPRWISRTSGCHHRISRRSAACTYQTDRARGSQAGAGDLLAGRPPCGRPSRRRPERENSTLERLLTDAELEKAALKAPCRAFPPLPAGTCAIDPNPRIHSLGLPTRRALLEPPVSVDHHDMARRPEEGG